MNMNGYCISKKCLTIFEIEQEIKKIQEKIKEISSEKYKKLLGMELARAYDLVSLNLLSIPKHEIFEASQKQLKEQIQISKMTGTPAVYDFQVFLHVLSHDSGTYVEMLANDKDYLQAMEDYEDLSLTSKETQEKGNKKVILWKSIFDTYEGRPALSVNLSYLPESEDVILPSLPERREYQARQHVINQYISRATAGKPIQPYQSVEVMEQAFAYLVSAEGQEELSEYKLKLTPILTKISVEELKNQAEEENINEDVE